MEIYYTLFFIFGVCIGSFCNVLICRMPLGKSTIYPPSHCPKCKQNLKYIHNIPLFSWIFLGGRCAFCKTKISIIYPLVELACGIFAMAGLYLGEGLVDSAFLGLCFILLFTLSIIDFKHNAVPEILLVSAYFFAVFSVPNLTFNILDGDFYRSPIIVSFIFAGGITIIKNIASAWINRKNNGEIIETMGDADSIIIAIIGLLLGVKLGVIAILLAGILQIILHIILRIKSNRTEAPFIPSLSFALFLVMIFRDFFLELFDIYTKFMGLK